ncbi:MAG: hypothetical protein E5X61_26320 [Mesorhizobium sp.]|nr:MAG: hypothetical protein E5X61_26320 [Mesorhizobium sp.]
MFASTVLLREAPSIAKLGEEQRGGLGITMHLLPDRQCMATINAASARRFNVSWPNRELPATRA